MEANGHTGESRVDGAVSIRDLEVAVVLAREMSAASSRAVEASLRADQIQEVFGAAALDDVERVRIQTALEMAGLRPTPSLLEVEVGGAVRFAVNAGAPAPSAPAEPGAPQAPAAAPPRRTEFPTVAEFARTALARIRGPKAPPPAAGPAANGTAPAASAPTPIPDAPGAARLDQLASILIPAVALPVVVTSLLGWIFGLPFIALGLIVSARTIAQARAAGATTGVGPVIRSSEAARTALKGIAAVTAAAFVVAIVLALAIGGSSDSSDATVDFPPAPITAPFGPDPAGRRERRESRAAIKRAQAEVKQRAQASRQAAAKRRADAKAKREKRERDKLIKQGLLNPDGTLTPEGQAQGVVPPGDTTQPGDGTTPQTGGTTTQPAPSGTTTTPATATP
jgi:hypothetical protein